MHTWTLLIAVHATTAVTCLLLGGYQILRRVKGDAAHRVVGWLWVAGMGFVTTSSFAIRELRHGRLSLLHVLSVVTLVSLVWGIVAIRRRNVPRHRGAMLGSWLGLVGAFVGAVAVPGRRIPTFALSDPLSAAAAAGLVVGLSVALIRLSSVLVHFTRLGRPRRRRRVVVSARPAATISPLHTESATAPAQQP